MIRVYFVPQFYNLSFYHSPMKRKLSTACSSSVKSLTVQKEQFQTHKQKSLLTQSRTRKAVDTTLTNTYNRMNRRNVTLAGSMSRFPFLLRHSENATAISDIHFVLNRKVVHIPEEFRFNRYQLSASCVLYFKAYVNFKSRLCFSL